MAKKRFTEAGTNLEEVKRTNAQTGNGKFQNGGQNHNLKEEFASEIFSQSLNNSIAGKTVAGTNIQKVREEIAQESHFSPQGAGELNTKKTPAGTSIQKVREEIAEEGTLNLKNKKNSTN